MASSGLRGSFPLTGDGINSNVTQTSAGAYALGRAEGDTFYIKYVGRSDKDVNDRLHDHVGTHPRFKFEYYGSAKAAFEKECRLYHDFDPPENDVHPGRPSGSGWNCPSCKVFD